MSIRELAEHFGVDPSAVWKWSRNAGFPSSLGFRVERLPHLKATRGRFPEVWDSHAVTGWLAAREQARVQRQAAKAKQQLDRMTERLNARERKRVELLETVRASAARGEPLRTIAAEAHISYTFVRASTTDVGRPPRGGYVRRVFADDELLAAVRQSKARTVYQYDAWRHLQVTRRPASSTIVSRFGGWNEARVAVIGQSSR